MAIGLLARRDQIRVAMLPRGGSGGVGVGRVGGSRCHIRVSSPRLSFSRPRVEAKEENVPHDEMVFVICEADYFFLRYFFSFFSFYIRVNTLLYGRAVGVAHAKAT